ncbi:MAG: radical SAM protein [Gemmatimonadetes bacterium]|nr:radical SAM protein [Gemmatimonadota bacterium]
MVGAPERHPGKPPSVGLASLDVLWFQVAGTICNLACTHCFISCSPSNHSFAMMPRADVERLLAESVAFGVREYYFTGGEPFAHPEMVEILEAALRYGPSTVLTNGTLLREDRVARLAQAAADSRYSLEFRISIDSFDAAEHDALRGEGSFARSMLGLDRLVAGGFLPIVTATRTWPLDRDDAVFQGFVSLLKERGYSRPRIKLIPALRLGQEALRAGGYDASDFVTAEMLAGFDLDQLICRSARVATSRGVYVCPILLDSPDARLGDTLAEAAAAPYPLRHQACTTCYMHGAICSNPWLGLGESAI